MNRKLLFHEYFVIRFITNGIIFILLRYFSIIIKRLDIFQATNAFRYERTSSSTGLS